MDEDGTIIADPRKYVDKSLSHMKNVWRAPMAGDHPKMTYLNFVIKTKSNNIKQTIVGQLIWLSGLGRFDIAVHIMMAQTTT